MFSTHPKTNFNFSVTFILPSANDFNLDQSKNLLFGKDLIYRQNAFNLGQAKILSFGKE